MDIDTGKSSILKITLIAAGASIIIFSMKFSASILDPFLLAGIIGICVLPATRWLMRKGVSTLMAQLITIVLISLGLLALIAIMYISIKNLVDTLPKYQENLQGLVTSLEQLLNNIGLQQSGLHSAVSSTDTGKFISFLSSFLGGILNDLSGVFVMLMVLIFFILGAPALKDKIIKNYSADSPIFSRLRNLIHDFQQYVGITTWVNFLVGLINTVFLLLMGIDFAILWGVLSFLTGYIPNIGFWIAAIPPFVLALMQYGIARALIVLVGYIVINGGVQNFLQPKMMGQGLNLSILVVTVSLFFWGWVLGPMGAILGVPMTMIVKEVLLDAFDDTRGLADLMSGRDSPPEKSTAKSK